MKIENSIFNNLEYKKIEFHFGNFFFFEDIIVGEVNEGVHFDLIKVIQVVDKLYNHYGLNSKIVYIANRINSYSTDPQTWPRLQERGDDFLIATALVSYNEVSFNVAAVERKLANIYIKRCIDINEAFNWAQQILDN